MAGNRWVRLDVDYFDNPKALAAGRDGRDLHLASICWVGRHLTDGRIPPAAVLSIAEKAGLDTRHRRVALAAVVDAGLWIPSAEGYELHDYTAMNGTKADVEKERDAWRARQHRHRRRDEQGRFIDD